MMHKYPGQFPDLVQAGAGIDSKHGKVEPESANKSAGKRNAPHAHQKAVDVEKRVAASGKHAVDDHGADASPHHVQCENGQHSVQTILCGSGQPDGA